MLGYPAKELKFNGNQFTVKFLQTWYYVSRDRSRDEAIQVTEC